MPFGKKPAASATQFSWDAIKPKSAVVKESAQLDRRQWSIEELQTETTAAGFDKTEDAFLAFLNGPGGSLWASFAAARSAMQIQVKRQIGHGPIQLCLGGTKPVPGWTIVNALPLPGVDEVADIGNLRRWADNTVDIVYMSHTVWQSKICAATSSMQTLKHRV